MSEESKPLTYRFHLPCGQDLLPLLEQQYVTVAILSDLLRSRGTFLNSAEKSDYVEALTLTYLTPREFDYLMSLVIDREQKRKVRNDYEEIKAEPEISFSKALPTEEELSPNKILEDLAPHCELIGNPKLVRINTHHYQLALEIRRRNLHSTWIKSEQIFPVEINVFEDVERSVIKIENWHTSEETRSLARSISRRMRKSMVTKGLIEKNNSKTLRFNSFTNSERIAFLMKFTGAFDGEIFSFDKLVDLSLRLDKNTACSDARLAWMKDSVSRLNLTGTALENTFFVTDLECRDHLLVWRFECKFTFEKPAGKGSIILALEFGGYGRSEAQNAPFQVTFSRINASRYKGSFKKIEKEIIGKLNDYQIQFHEAVSTPVN